MIVLVHLIDLHPLEIAARDETPILSFLTTGIWRSRLRNVSRLPEAGGLRCTHRRARESHSVKPHLIARGVDGKNLTDETWLPSEVNNVPVALDKVVCFLRDHLGQLPKHAGMCRPKRVL